MNTPSSLAADPIPAGRPVYDTMPGNILAGPELYRAVNTTPSYVVELRSNGHWYLPNHDDPATMSSHSVNAALAKALTYGHPARFSVTTYGVVYVSNGLQAARYIPTTLIPGHSPDHCPGCGTPYTRNGDGPCPGVPAGPPPPPFEVIVHRDPDGDTTLTYFRDGQPVTAADLGLTEYHIDPGASGGGPEWAQSIRTMAATASPAAAAELLDALD